MNNLLVKIKQNTKPLAVLFTNQVALIRLELLLVAHNLGVRGQQLQQTARKIRRRVSQLLKQGN